VREFLRPLVLRHGSITASHCSTHVLLSAASGGVGEEGQIFHHCLIRLTKVIPLLDKQLKHTKLVLATLLVAADKRNENFFSEPLVENAAHGAREQKGDYDTRRARARSRFYAPTCDFDKHKLAQRDFLSGSENLACESW
jgi:hypothetical protein